MTKAGLDPSRIQERAEMLAKVQGAKRKRDADDGDKDVEMDDDGASGSDKGMDVDDDESAPTKRVKTNSGGVINKRAPRSNRQMAGMRDEGVSGFFSFLCFFAFFHFFTKTWLIYLFVAIHSCNQASQSWSTSSQYACESRRRRSCHQNQNGKDFLFFHSIIGFLILHSLTLSLAETSIQWQTQRWKDTKKMIVTSVILFFCFAVFLLQ